MKMLSGQDVRNRLGISTQTMERWLLAGQFPAPAEHPDDHKRAGRKWTVAQLKRFEHKRDALAALGAKPADAGTTALILALYGLASVQREGDLAAASGPIQLLIKMPIEIDARWLPDMDAVVVTARLGGYALAAGLIVAADPWQPIVNGRRQPLPCSWCAFFVVETQQDAVKMGYYALLNKLEEIGAK